MKTRQSISPHHYLHHPLLLRRQVLWQIRCPQRRQNHGLQPRARFPELAKGKIYWKPVHALKKIDGMYRWLFPVFSLLQSKEQWVSCLTSRTCSHYLDYQKLADASRCKCISATMWQQLYRYHNQHWGIPMIFQPCPQFLPKLQRQCCATTAAARDRWPTARWPRSTAQGRWMPRTSLDILGSCWGTPKMQALNTWENAGKMLGKCMECHCQRFHG